MPELFDILRDALAERYTLQRQVGRGGMATVFLAEDVRHGRLVALKVLHPELAAAAGAERFQREIAIAARLQHPHIVPLYDSGTAGDHLFFVMPFVEGESLRERLAREHQLSLEDAVKIAGEVGSALSYAHRQQIVHRDIKPENIMLSGGAAVVTDFGIARAVSAAGVDQLTQTGTAVGTPQYMSPEQAAADSEVDARSDQYSLACVVYEMLVGEPPFTGASARSIMARHSLDAVSPPTILRPTIPEGVEDAVLRALEKVPADRFPTCTAFVEALGRPSDVTAARRRPTLSRPATRRRGLRRMVWVAGAAALAAAALWFTRGTWSRAPQAASAGFDPRHVAVVYFDDRSPGHSLGYIADGLTEALIQELASISELQVVSRNGVAPFKGVAVTPDSIARALNVGTIVDGTVTPVGDSLRVSVELASTATGAVLGSTTIRGSRADLVVLQDDLAREVSMFLRQRLGEEIQELHARAGTRSGRAWELVQYAAWLRSGLGALLESGDTSAAARQLVRADSTLALAATLDPRWTTPIVRRGWLEYERRHIAGFDKAAAADWLGRGSQFADQALQVDPHDAEALRLRGTLRYVRWVLNLNPAPLSAEGLLAAAEADLRAGADTSNPNRASALALLSHLLLRRSATAEGKLAAQQAYEADPYLQEAPDVLNRLFLSSVDLEDATEAARWCREGYRRFPDLPIFTECQITVGALPGQHPNVDQAWQLLERSVGMYPPHEQEYRRKRGELLVALVLARAGLADSARAVALRARADAAVDPTRDLVYIEAMLRNQLGDREEALRLVALYLATNPQDRATLAEDRTWWWRGLRDDPRFQALVAH